MKKLFSSFIALCFCLTLCAQNNPCPSSVKDVEGNTYKTVKLGEQCWMRENLRVQHFANGDPIAFMKSKIFLSNTIYSSLNDPKSGCKEAYGYDPRFNETESTSKGFFYNWSAAAHTSSVSKSEQSSAKKMSDDVEKTTGKSINATFAKAQLCPEGWHVPSSKDFEAVANNPEYAKSFSNTTGRVEDLSYLTDNNPTYWTSDRKDANFAYCYIFIPAENILVKSPVVNKIGYSVRCVKD